MQELTGKTFVKTLGSNPESMKDHTSQPVPNSIRPERFLLVLAAMVLACTPEESSEWIMQGRSRTVDLDGDGRQEVPWCIACEEDDVLGLIHLVGTGSIERRQDAQTNLVVGNRVLNTLSGSPVPTFRIYEDGSCSVESETACYKLWGADFSHVPALEIDRRVMFHAGRDWFDPVVLQDESGRPVFLAEPGEAGTLAIGRDLESDGTLAWTEIDGEVESLPRSGNAHYVYAQLGRDGSAVFLLSGDSTSDSYVLNRLDFSTSSNDSVRINDTFPDDPGMVAASANHNGFFVLYQDGYDQDDFFPAQCRLAESFEDGIRCTPMPNDDLVVAAEVISLPGIDGPVVLTKEVRGDGARGPGRLAKRRVRYALYIETGFLEIVGSLSDFEGSVLVADLDGDGFDEIVYGNMYDTSRGADPRALTYVSGSGFVEY